MSLVVAAHDTGVLQPLVRVVGWFFCAVAAIALTWRGRAPKWEPAEEDLSGAPAKVAGLICVVVLAVMWVRLGSAGHSQTLVVLAGSFAAACLLAVIVYGILIGTHVYNREVSLEAEKSTHRKIIGGLWLRRGPKQELKRHEAYTIQKMLSKAGYDPDVLWSRTSRSLAKTLFALAYITLTVCGTLAVAAIGIFLLANHVG